jgi:20S proteasome alpha/beta subunit
MTLVAGFRCRNSGVLLCADREENDGISKREVDKISRILHAQGYVFIAGAGVTSILLKFHEAVEKALNGTVDLQGQHVRILEDSLSSVLPAYYPNDQWNGVIAPIIVVAFHIGDIAPLMYRTDGSSVLIKENLYTAAGSGKPICDYLTDRLYQHGIDKASLGAMAAFILREAEESVHGVGLGANMVFIHEGDRALQYIEKDYVKDIQAKLPSLGDMIWPHWKAHVMVPGWLEG